MDLLTNLGAGRTDAQTLLGSHGQTVLVAIGLLLAKHHLIIGQLQQIGPKLQGLTSHGSPSNLATGEKAKSQALVSVYTIPGCSARFAETRPCPLEGMGIEI